ncbi:Prestin [Armadillidium nasatum]|uniref:Prestin n=1 Tax=Armadillidium nasatum TaxID=96803 RepID=A0A5N5T895_9CRUS|nr:Prestin [Armadillidium nasatum]
MHPYTHGIKERLKSDLKKSCSCSAEKVKKFVYGKLPILSWLIGYDFKNWFVPDCIAGITVAILQIPQGMGFALLAQIPAICGIYMAFYQGLIYVFLGTCRQNSMGKFFCCNYTYDWEGCQRVSNIFSKWNNNGNNARKHNRYRNNSSFNIAQMVFGFLQLGTLSVFLSDMLVSGFTTAAAVHVLTSQVYIEIFKSLHLVNILTIVISVVAITVLFINNEVLKPIVAKYSKVPIPIELIVVVIGTTASYFANLTETYDVNIIGDVPVGKYIFDGTVNSLGIFFRFPPAEVPPMELMGRVMVDSFVIAVVSFTITFSLAKIFSVKHSYPVDATQELYASGIGNLVSSFFACAPTSASLSRALVQDAAGGVTQMATLIVCILIVLVLLFIGPVFKTLPKAVLASIIVVALKGMFMQFRDMIAMWKISKIEAITWLITFFSTVIIDIDYGLLVGVIFSIFVLLTKNQRPTCFVLGRLANTDLYLDLKTYPQVNE